MSKGISPELKKAIIETLRERDEVDTDKELRAIFLDKRLYAWRDKLPEAITRRKRIELVIDELATKFNRDYEKNALTLLIEVLRDLTDKADQSHGNLDKLAERLDREHPYVEDSASTHINRQLPEETKATSNKITITKLRSWAPTAHYLDFVRRYMHTKHRDPFTLDVSWKNISNIYVGREQVEQAINSQDFQIIAGPRGRGKSTLSKHYCGEAPAALHGKTLIIPLSAINATTGLSEDYLLRGMASVLSPEILVRHIFNAYWEALICSSRNQGRFLGSLEKNDAWFSGLKWFYHFCRPQRYKLDLKYLMDRLHTSYNDEHLAYHIVPRDALPQLIGFVTQPHPLLPSYGSNNSFPQVVCDSIIVYVDGAEYLSDAAFKTLMRDFYNLKTLSIRNLSCKVFVDDAMRDLLPKNGIEVYELPPWDKKDLENLLENRAMTYSNNQIGKHWTHDFPDSCLRHSAKQQWMEILILGAMQSQRDTTLKGEVDAPIHVLRLARAFVAACADCWSEYTPPIDREMLSNIVQTYWRVAQENEHAQ